MLSLVLPLLALAIALTPVVASARVAYRREVDEQVYCFDHDEAYNPSRSKTQQRESVGTTVCTLLLHDYFAGASGGQVL